jgi:hypothetical protein
MWQLTGTQRTRDSHWGYQARDSHGGYPTRDSHWG